MDLNLMRELSVVTDSKIVLLVLDGLGGLPMDPFGRTELEAAYAPNFDALAARSDLGLQARRRGRKPRQRSRSPRALRLQSLKVQGRPRRT